MSTTHAVDLTPPTRPLALSPTRPLGPSVPRCLDYIFSRFQRKVDRFNRAVKKAERAAARAAKAAEKAKAKAKALAEGGEEELLSTHALPVRQRRVPLVRICMHNLVKVRRTKVAYGGSKRSLG